MGVPVTYHRYKAHTDSRIALGVSLFNYVFIDDHGDWTKIVGTQSLAQC